MICDVALDEFAQYPFDQASVNRIVAGAGIAKGSFYQYFEDKQDLYLYLMSLIAEEKINYLSPLILNPAGHDIFTVIREMFLAGVQFANEHPRYAAIGDKLLVDKESSIYRELQTQGRPTSFAVFEPLLKQAIDKGEVRADFDIRMLNHIITTMAAAIVEYCLELHPESAYETMGESVDAFIDILKNGIGTKMVHSPGS